MNRIWLLLLVACFLWADGGMIPPIDHEIYGADQVAVIKILPDSEELSILAKFDYTYEYNGFAWVVPLPSLPSIYEISESLFINLSNLSASYQRYGGCHGSYYEGYGYGNDYFQIISFPKIEFLQSVLIQTNRADSLASWLINNGYELPEGATGMFQDYIDRHWQFFFIARADTSSHYYGRNVGVRFRFATDTIIYPMKISSLSSMPGIALYLYVIGEHKIFFDNAELLYANRISKEELEAIEQDLPHLFDYIKEGDYITKLKRFYGAPSQMSSDIVLYQSPDDIEYRREEEYYWYFGLTNSMLSPFVFYTLYLCFIRIIREKRRRR